jgi:hypothetical protein
MRATSLNCATVLDLGANGFVGPVSELTTGGARRLGCGLAPSAIVGCRVWGHEEREAR